MTAENKNNVIAKQTVIANGVKQSANKKEIASAKKLRNDVRVPKLRFNEFEGEWEKKKLGDIGKVKMCKRIFSSETTETGDIPFYKIGTFGKKPDAFITKKLYKNYRERFSFPKIGDILMSASGTLGRTVVYDGVEAYFQDSNIVWIDNNEELITNSFLFYIYQIVKYDSEGGTIQRLYNSIINRTKFSKPNLPEQQKIATFLTAVDTKIQQLTTKKEYLENYKKGVMQQLFSQQLRFKNDDGLDFPDWEEKKLGEVSIITMGQSPDSKSYNEKEEGTFLIQGNADIKGRITSPRQWTSEPTKTCEIGDLILTVRAPVGSIAKSLHNACIGRGVCSIKNNNHSNIEYLYQFLLSYELKWIGLEQGSTFTAVSGKDIKSLKSPFPSLKEQQKIANYLSAIDIKIENVQTQIEKTQAFKKGLLQQMFV